MSKVTRRDEAWHAVIMTAIEAGKTGKFRLQDVVETAERLDESVSRRTCMKVMHVMERLGYLAERDYGYYAPDGPFVADLAVEIVRPPQSEEAEP